MNISLASDQTVLVGGKGCFVKVENHPEAIPVEVEFPEDIIADGIIKDRTGDYWVGNIAKVLRFRPDGVPPETRIIGNVTNILQGGRLTVSIEAVERFRPLNRREDFSISWCLDDQKWQPFVQGIGREFSIPVPGIGKHTIAVRARDSGGDIDRTPSVFGFTVHPLPLQSRGWFLWSVATVILLLTFLSLVAVRARAELASYARTLERRVAERTAALEADLVERGRAGAALRESEERWQFALEGSGDGLWDWNILTNQVHYSSRWKSMLGYRDDEISDVLGEWDKRVHPEDKPRVLSLLEPHLDGTTPLYVSEHRLLCKDGSYKWILARGKVMTRTPDGRPVRIIGTHSDISERKESERIVQETQERFHQLAENIREVFWLTNAEKSQVLYISPGYERIWGRTCESLHKSPGSWLESIHAEDRDRVGASMLDNQSTGTYDVEYRILRPDGSVRWIHDRAFPVRDASGSVYRIAGIAEDITERRQFEAQYRQAQKMEALGTLSGGIAHDFNNILGAIVGNVQLATFDLEPTHPATQSLVEIQKAANRARDLVQQILAFSRRQPKSRHSLRVETVVIEAVGLLRASLPAGIELVKTLDPNAPNIFADATQIHQVLLNLCTNAWHAIGDGPGRIEIQVQAVEIRESEATNTSDLRPGRYVRLSVIDTGQGMDSATVERIFEPFFTTKELGRGTGLGLSVVLGIVQSHDGVIRVSSQLGMGTAFHLYFPTVAADTSEALPAVRTVQPGVGQRILYLDDEKPLVDASVQMLRRLSYTADGCTDPREALEILRKNPSRYHLIITDLHMPEVSGIEFIQSVRSFLPSLPIVLSSGHLTEEVAARARKLGVTKLLHKPNTLEDFGVSIHELLSVRES